ncbi:MAG: cytochrome c4 [Betaproteobacteria bacterium]|nr:cytochrome c4 [Betaproteobacteria bacterium]
MTSQTLLRIAALAILASPLVAQAGDASKAISLAGNLCASCHGEDGNSAIPNFPKLAGQQVVYLLRELKDYKSGKRQNEVMGPLVSGLADDDLANLAAFYASQKPAPGTVTEPSLLPVGKTLYLKGNAASDIPSCESCHEVDGSGSGKFPRVAGQNVEYLLEQFRLYAAGKRNNGTRVMRTIAERMSEKETRAVSEYMASMP